MESIDKQWSRLMLAHQERDQAILDELKRLERLQRLAEKVHRELKQVDTRLGELEQRVEEEARRFGDQRLALDVGVRIAVQDQLHHVRREVLGQVRLPARQ